MKKNVFILFLLFISLHLVAQKTISGKVVDIDNIPLEGASVYINNSSIGTTTNAKGEFNLTIKDGVFDIIVSYISFKTIKYSLNTEKFNSRLLFKLEEDANLLDEVVIYNTKYNKEWEYNLKTFRDNFIGRTKMAKNCKILNPKALHFIFDAKNIKLTAIAKEPLKIKHKDLGYLITFDLVDFTMIKNSVTYLGYSKYQSIKGSKRKQKKWKENRLKTYEGSIIHFSKSLLKGNFKEEGYIVHQFKRVKNPKRPSDDEIKKARELIKLNRSTIDFSKSIKTPKTAIDSALVIFSKSRLPKYQDFLYKSDISIDDIVTKRNNKTFITFENCLSVVYTKEKEEKGFYYRSLNAKHKNTNFQTSSIIKINENPYIYKTGVIVNPLDVFFEGYWSYEKFANVLPLDYEPSE